MQLTEAKLFWWIMPKGTDGHGRALLKGHTALINQNERFDISDARSNRIAHFGVLVGRDRVIIYIEPKNAVQNTARTGLKKADGSDLSWDRWQDEFRDKMPNTIRDFIAKLLDETAKDSHTETIRDRLKSLRELYKLSRYKPNSDVKLKADPNSITEFATGYFRKGNASDNTSSQTNGRGSVEGSLASRLLSGLVDEASASGINVIEANPDPFPKVEWTTEDKAEQLIDRAAEYVATSNIILANKDFRGFEDLVHFFSKGFEEPEIKVMIRKQVQEALEQLLMECVAGALSLKNRPKWNLSDFQAAVSKEALTTAVMQRYWVISHIKRVLGSKIKGFNDAMKSSDQ